MKAAIITILIATVFFSCSDTSEEIIPIREETHLNDGSWGAYNTTFSFTVNGDEFTDILMHPSFKDYENNSKVIFFGDSIRIEGRIIPDTGGTIYWNWFMKWEPGLHESNGYMTLVKEDGTPWMETKAEYLFYKLN